MTPEEQAALDAAKEAEALAAKAKAGNGQDPKPVTQADLDEQIKQRRAANHEAQAAKKRADDLEAKFKAQEDAKKDDLTRAQERAVALERDLAAAKAESAHAQDVSASLAAGVQEQYAPWVAQKVAEFRAQNLDVKAELAKMKANSPAFFGAPASAAGASSGGGAPEGTNVQAQIEKLRKEIADAHRVGDVNKVWTLRKQLGPLEHPEQQAQH